MQLRPMVWGLIVVLFVFPLRHALAEYEPARVWVDTDLACPGGRMVDVDDCWALALLLVSPSVEIAGVSTVYGNVDNAPDTAAVRAVIDLAGGRRADFPVVAGANEAGAPSLVATDAIAQALEDGPLDILALGPLTNIAALLAQRPHLHGHIRRIVAVAGRYPGERFSPGDSRFLHVHDMNFRKDVDAFEAVLSSRIQISLVPYRAGSQVSIAEEELARLSAGRRAARWLASISGDWLDFWRSFFGADGFHPFDLVAAAHLVDSSALSCDETDAAIVRRRGLFVVRDTLEVATGHGRPVRYCAQVSPQLGHGLVDRLLREKAVTPTGS